MSPNAAVIWSASFLPTLHDEFVCLSRLESLGVVIERNGNESQITEIVVDAAAGNEKGTSDEASARPQNGGDPDHGRSSIDNSNLVVMVLKLDELKQDHHNKPI